MATRSPTPPDLACIPPAAPRTESDESDDALEPPVVTAKGTRDLDELPPRIIERGPSARRGMESDERVTMIAHDAKTPLAIIMLESQLLAERLLDPAVQHSLARIMQNAAYIDRLIADLLDLASVEAGVLHQQLRLERVDLHELIRETIERAVSSLDRGRVHVELRHATYVRGDRNRLERVIANLLGNALKYSTAPVTIVLDRNGHRARVKVIDQGQGLTPEQSRTVFDRYRRVATTTRGRDGHGLGLYISRKIIDAHHGRIGVVSIVAQGSEFFFELDTIA